MPRVPEPHVRSVTSEPSTTSTASAATDGGTDVPTTARGTTTRRQADRHQRRFSRERLALLIIPAAITLVALAVRVYRLAHWSYWLDELLQVYFIHGTWNAFWSSLRADAVHPPLDYLISRFVEFLNPSDPIRRIPAVVWGTLSIPVFMAFVRRRAGTPVAYVGAIILALAPFHVRYSQEFRPYALAVFTVLIALLTLDRYLDQPGVTRLTLLFLACVAAEYTLYLGALILAIASGSLLIEDALTATPERRRAARRFLLASPLFGLALWIAYLPWWPVLWAASHRPPASAAPAFSLQRFGVALSFFSFAPNDGNAATIATWAYALLLLIGLAVAARRPGLRFVIGWVLLGMGTIEVLEHLHPHYYVPRHYLPSAIAFPLLAALALTWLGRRNLLRILIAAGLLVSVLGCEFHGLRQYYANGRERSKPWRTLATYLRKAPADERIFTENQFVQLFLGYYLVGPGYLHDLVAGHPARAIIPLPNSSPVPLSWAWWPRHNAWLALLDGSDGHPALKQWAAPYPFVTFPGRDHTVILKVLRKELHP